MCEPISMFGATAAASSTGVATSGLFGAANVFGWGQTLTTLGSASGIFGSIYSSQTQQANYDYQAHMANYNAAIADNNAVMAEQAAEFEADLFDVGAPRHFVPRPERSRCQPSVVSRSTFRVGKCKTKCVESAIWRLFKHCYGSG